MTNQSKTQNMQSAPASQAPVRSAMAGDPEMGELIEFFVGEMPGRVRTLEELWQAQKLEEIRGLAHQLKGASGGYGFGVIGETAAKLEATLKSLNHGGQDQEIENLRREFAELVDLCKRVTR